MRVFNPPVGVSRKTSPSVILSEAALPSPGEKVAERSEVGCGMRAITLRKQSGIILADGKFSAGLCHVEDPTFFPAFHLSQLR